MRSVSSAHKSHNTQVRTPSRLHLSLSSSSTLHSEQPPLSFNPDETETHVYRSFAQNHYFQEHMDPYLIEYFPSSNFEI